MYGRPFFSMPSLHRSTTVLSGYVSLDLLIKTKTKMVCTDLTKTTPIRIHIIFIHSHMHNCKQCFIHDMYVYTKIFDRIIFQILMSVVMEHTIAPKYVQTLKEASIVNVMVAFYWTLIELHVTVCRTTCTCIFIYIHN